MSFRCFSPKSGATCLYSLCVILNSFEVASLRLKSGLQNQKTVRYPKVGCQRCLFFQIGFLGTWWFSRCPDSVPKTIVWASLAFYPGVLSSSCTPPCTPPGPPPSTPTSGGSPSTPLSESDFGSESDDDLHMEDVCKADPIPRTYVMAGLFERFVSRTARSTTRCPSTIHTSTSWSWRICEEDGWQYSKDGAKTYIIFTQKQCSFDCVPQRRVGPCMFRPQTHAEYEAWSWDVYGWLVIEGSLVEKLPIYERHRRVKE